MTHISKNKVTEPGPDKPQRPGAYIFITICLTFIFPLASVLIEYSFYRQPIDPGHIGKWFAFWGIGVRLFSAGLSQSLNPMFTAVTIFKMRTRESFIVIRELGFANISMGLVGIISLFLPEFLPAIALTGGLFLLLDGIAHFMKKPDSKNEVVAMVTDLIIFAVMFLYLSFKYFS